jgi:hypothetical protein
MSSVMTAELVIEEKTADGFRVSLTFGDATVDGPSPRAEMMRAFLAVARGTVVRGMLDARGKPVRITNLADVQAARRAAIDRLVAAAKPEAAATLRQLLTTTLLGKDGAEFYFEDLPDLSLGQGSGMKVGEKRSDSEVVQGPFGGPVKVAKTFRLESRDAASGKSQFVLTETYDPESMTAAAMEVARRLGGAKATPAELERAAKMMSLTFDARAELEVEGGMTRVLRQTKALNAIAPGNMRRKRDTKTVTVSPAR